MSPLPDQRTSAARACVLAVGTELTTGQIPNGNAAWLSERLTDLGLEVALHETVPDDRPLIHAALERCAKTGDFLFVTGGLGPTTDDFTREVVAEWLGRKLIFHEPSWQHISTRLSALGVPLVQSQRQQCVYPEGAEVFTNEVGTANAFYNSIAASITDTDTASADSPGGRAAKHVWVLPGPPRELGWLWDNCVGAHVRGHAPRAEAMRLLRWHCLGRSEAELGEAVERALEGSGLKTGYRFQRPYVEVKVWCPESRLTESREAFERLERTLGSAVVAKDGADLVEEFLRGLSLASEIEVFDAATAGILTERLGRWLREPKYGEVASSLTVNTEWVSPDSPSEWVTGLLGAAEGPGLDSGGGLVLAVGGFTSSGDWAIGLRLGDRIFQEALTLPYRNGGAVPEMLERIRRYATEVAIQRWTRALKQFVN